MPINRYQQQNGIEAVRRRLQGMKDPRSKTGIMSRGLNVYANGTYAAHTGGGPQFGRPVGSRDVNHLQAAINRRMAQRNRYSRVRSSY